MIGMTLQADAGDMYCQRISDDNLKAENGYCVSHTDCNTTNELCMLD